MRFFILLIACLLGHLLPAQDLLLQGATLLDPATQTRQQKQVWIKDGQVKAVLDKAPAEFSGEILDFSGQFLLPGLYDLHVHSWGNPGTGAQMEFLGTVGSAERMLYCGVTGMLDLFSLEKDIFALRDRQRAGQAGAADIFAAGPILTCTGGHGTEYGIPTRTADTPAEARTEVIDLARSQPDVVKLVYAPHGSMPSMDVPTMQAVIRTADSLGFKTVVHIESWEGVYAAARAGASAVTHSPEGLVPDSVFSLLAARGTVWIPTLCVHGDLLHYYQQPERLQAELLQGAVKPQLLAGYADTAAYDPQLKAWLDYQRRHTDLGPNLRRLAEAGVPILAGTDAGNPGVFQGYSLHRELARMVEAGLSPWQALAAATSEARDFLGLPGGFEPGSPASFVALGSDPTRDIAATTGIRAVIHRGQVIDREGVAAGTPAPASAARTQASIDNFRQGHDGWEVMTDSRMGGGSTLELSAAAPRGLRLTGQLQPTDASPYAWVSATRLLNEQAEPEDLSNFTGIRLRLRTEAGEPYLSLMTAEVTNFDYPMHLLPDTGGEWQVIELPFEAFQQMRTQPPLPWTGKQVLGLNLGASAPQAGSFAFEIAWIELF